MKKVCCFTGLCLAVSVLAGCCSSLMSEESALSNIIIEDTQVFPESITSTSDGTVYVGSVKGNVYKASPGDATAKPWISTSKENGILTILGVLADPQSATLWLCSVPNFFGPERSEGLSSLMAFDLNSGEQKGVYSFPAPASVCNDISIGPNGSAYATDTSNGRIFVLDKGADELRLFGVDDSLVGIDGIAFSEDGTLYVNNVRTNEILRVGMAEGNTMGSLKSLTLSHQLGGPDGFRLIEGNRFVQAEGTIGRVSVVTIEGDTASLEVLNDTLESTPGATAIGNTVYAIESNIQYLINPDLKDQEPSEFVIHALPFSK